MKNQQVTTAAAPSMWLLDNQYVTVHETRDTLPTV
jgi:hypothetical protein